MKYYITFILLAVVFFLSSAPVNAQVNFDILPNEVATDESSLATDSASATASAETEKIEQIKKEDVTKPEEPLERREIIAFLNNRPVTEPSVFNIVAYAVQYAVRTAGIPSNTVMLILLLPLLATLVAFSRHVIGLPSLGMLVPIALSITLLATGLGAGSLLLLTIIFASTLARILLKKVRIMQLPKLALSLFMVSIFVFGALTISATAGVLVVRQISIFPILLFILLSERVIALQLERSTKETITISLVTVLLGVLGFAILSFEPLRRTVLLYPELVFLLIPINFLIGRYFGLRVTEYFRFAPLFRNASK